MNLDLLYQATKLVLTEASLLGAMAAAKVAYAIRPCTSHDVLTPCLHADAQSLLSPQSPISAERNPLSGSKLKADQEYSLVAII